MDASSMLDQLLSGAGLAQPSFGPESRYYGLATASWRSASGEEVRYVTRRFIPSPASFALLQRHRVQQGDRVDVLAAALLGDPLGYWRLCDANGVLDPDDLTALPGAFIRITLPAGLPGTAGG